MLNFLGQNGVKGHTFKKGTSFFYFMLDNQARVSRVEKPRVDLSYLSSVLFKHEISTTSKEQSKFTKWRMHFGDRFRKKIIDDYAYGEFITFKGYPRL